MDFLALGLSRASRFAIAVVLTCGAPALAADYTYDIDDSDFRNPERGLYLHQSVNLLRCGADGSFVQADAYGAVVERGFSLVYHRMDLAPWIDRDLEPGDLACLRTNLAKLRDHGLKVIVRPNYRDRSETCPGGKPRIGFFCDATREQAKRHIEQLAPVWSDHADVIAYFEGGYVGDFGEQHSSEHWDFNPTDDDTCGDVKAFWDYLLARTPRNRFVGQRYPRVQGVAACGEYARPITPQTAFDGSNNSRLHVWNDGQLKDKYNGGTYWCRSYLEERDYFDRRADWSLGVGEMDGIKGVCRVDECVGFATPRSCCAERRDGCSEADLRACERHGGCDESWSGCEKALEEFARHNYTAIRYYPRAGGRGRQNVEKLMAGGCWDSLVKRLGYRLRLVSARLPDQARAGTSIDVEIVLVNDGFGRIYNRRPVFLVWQKRGATERVEVPLDVDPRRWSPRSMTASHVVRARLEVPVTSSAATYDVFLWLPDEDGNQSGLRANPAYSIRLANARGMPGDFPVWDEKTGTNRIGSFRVLDAD